MNGRKKTILRLALALLLLAAVTAAGWLCGEKAGITDFSNKNLAPGWEHPFGTDWMGRDMLSRTLVGLSLSIRLGLCTAAVSALLALLLGLAAALLGKKVDSVITFLIDMVMGIPHILLLILISFAFGKGFAGVAAGVALTHWPSLARLIRGEVLQLKESEYILTAGKLGVSPWQIALQHMLPHLLPQLLVGLLMTFPHAILHEASITFLGFGLSGEQPAIGLILSESMRYLITGKWWLTVLPGAMLVMVAAVFDLAGKALRSALDPFSVQE